MKVQYDYIPKYCVECKLQGHDMKKCRIIHLELKTIYKGENKKQASISDGGHTNQNHVRRLQKGKTRILSSGKVVGDPGNWQTKASKNNHASNVNNTRTNNKELATNNKFVALLEEHENGENTENEKVNNTNQEFTNEIQEDNNTSASINEKHKGKINANTSCENNNNDDDERMKKQVTTISQGEL